jgi:hypothetical protein
MSLPVEQKGDTQSTDDADLQRAIEISKITFEQEQQRRAGVVKFRDSITVYDGKIYYLCAYSLLSDNSTASPVTSSSTVSSEARNSGGQPPSTDLIDFDDPLQKLAYKKFEQVKSFASNVYRQVRAAGPPTITSFLSTPRIHVGGGFPHSHTTGTFTLGYTRNTLQTF